MIQVSAGSDTRSPYDILHGLYSLSEDKSAGNNPVWKQKDGNYYTSNTGSSKGFRIGEEVDIKTGQSYYFSKKYIFSFSMHVSKSQYFFPILIFLIYYI